MSAPYVATPPGRDGVTVVLVSQHDAARLPDVLDALARQTVGAARQLGVDTGGSEESAKLLRGACDVVLTLAPDTGFAAAVHAALAQEQGSGQTRRADATDGWLWMLSADAAPAPDALQRLLEHAGRHPQAALMGPKVLDWEDPGLLVQLGLTTDTAGRLDHGVEPGERDQGQRDEPRPVLAIGSLGALARRDVWDQLGGLDPALIAGEDLDLGWRVTAAGYDVAVVPAATMRQAHPPATGGGSAADAGEVADRRAAAYVLLAHAPRSRLVGWLLGLMFGGLLRSLGLLLTRRPRAAGGELAWIAEVATHPLQLRKARRLRRTQCVRGDAALSLLTTRRRTWRRRLSSRRALAGPTYGRPALALTALFTLFLLVAGRHLYTGGPLSGGALLPATDRVGTLWAAFLSEGGTTDLALVAAASTVLVGQVDTAVSLLLLASPVLAGLTAYVAVGQLVRPVALRFWAALTWSLLPVATAGLAQGRLDVAVTQLALPLLLLGGWRVLSRDPRVVGWWPAWLLGFGLALTAAFAPGVWPVLSLVLVVPAVAAGRSAPARRRVLAALVATGTPLLLLLPGTGASVLPHLMRTDTSPWRLLALSPQGPGAPPWWFTGLLAVAAIVALAQRHRVQVTAGGTALALVGLGYALVAPEAGLQLAAAGLLTSLVVAADGLRNMLGSRVFGRQQVFAALLVLGVLVTPLLLVGHLLVRGLDGPLQRSPAVALPAFVVAELQAAPGRQVLVLRPGTDGSIGYDLTGPDGQRLGVAGPSVLRSGGRNDGLTDSVTGLVSGQDAAAAQRLADQGTRFVVLPSSGSAALVAALDRAPGLSPEFGDRVWRVTATSAMGGAAGRSSDRVRIAVPVQVAVLVVVLVLAAPPWRGASVERRRR